MSQADTNIRIRALAENDLATADHVMRVAFGTFVGMPQPETFMGDADFVHTRWRADPSAAFVAEIAGVVAGSNFATQWGSVGFFGPLSVRPDFWNRGIAQRLMEPVMDCFARWHTRHAGLFTFAQSAKHVGLYQKFGFAPRFLTAVMGKSVQESSATMPIERYSRLRVDERPAALAACRQLTDAVFDGLDVTREICAVADQHLGDTLLLWDGSVLVGFAVCHYGPGTEAGSGACYVKFGAVRPGASADRWFEALLTATEQLAYAQGASRLIAGMNTARHEAYRQMLSRGFRIDIQGVSMHRPNTEGYSRPATFVIDDWR